MITCRALGASGIDKRTDIPFLRAMVGYGYRVRKRWIWEIGLRLRIWSRGKGKSKSKSKTKRQGRPILNKKRKSAISGVRQRQEKLPRSVRGM